MPAPKAETAGRGGESLTRAYWTYKIESMTGPVAQFRMAQLIDYDRRLTDPARTVYRFLIGWYMHAKHGDALASVRHIVATMRSRAPDGARHLSRSAVQRAIILLIECGWLVRTHVGKGRGGSRYVPVLNVLELASQGTLPDAASISVPDHRDATEISLVSHSTGTEVSHSTGTQSAVASHSTGTKTLLLDPSTDGATERENDPRPPTAPPFAGGLAATAAGGSAVEEEERAQTKPTFELLWRTYGPEKRGGKPEARAAWKALPHDTELAAVIDAAAAWRESWSAQNNPKAGRYTLAKWLAGERYEQEAPTGYQPKERAKASSKSTNGTMVPMTIVDVKEVGDVFSNLFVSITLKDDAGATIQKQLHAFDVNADAGRGPDVDSYFELQRAVCDGALLGSRVGVKQSKGVLSFHDIGQPAPKPEPEPNPWVGDVGQFSPFGTFPTTILDSAYEWNEHGQLVTLMLDITDNSGGMEITRQVDHTFDMETAKGQAFLASICRAVGITSIEDTDVLHGKVLECTITDRGAISYAALPTLMQEAA
jgi:hypothetical protein